MGREAADQPFDGGWADLDCGWLQARELQQGEKFIDLFAWRGGDQRNTVSPALMGAHGYEVNHIVADVSVEPVCQQIQNDRSVFLAFAQLVSQRQDAGRAFGQNGHHATPLKTVPLQTLRHQRAYLAREGHEFVIGLRVGQQHAGARTNQTANALQLHHVQLFVGEFQPDRADFGTSSAGLKECGKRAQRVLQFSGRGGCMNNPCDRRFTSALQYSP